MLSPDDRAAVRGGFEELIDLLGSTVKWVPSPSSHATASRTMVAGVRPVGADETDVVNAYGIDARIVTAKVSDFKTDQPQKFDRFELGDEVLVVHHVRIDRVNNAKALYTCYCRGD